MRFEMEWRRRVELSRLITSRLERSLEKALPHVILLLAEPGVERPQRGRRERGNNPLRSPLNKAIFY
jgi:hypothetical protein